MLIFGLINTFPPSQTKSYRFNFVGGLTTLSEQVVTLLLAVVAGFAIPACGLVTGLDTTCLGVGALGLGGFVHVSVMVRTGFCISAGIVILG